MPTTTPTHHIHPDIEGLAFPVDKLDQLPGNPNIGDVDAVARSYEQFGQRKPIVATRNRKRGTIIAGNTQHLAARDRLEWTHIAVVFVDDDDATARAFALADNHTAELGQSDDAALANMLREVRAADMGLFVATGYTNNDLTSLLERFRPEHDNDDQGRLDVTTAQTCPSCGFHWRMSGGEVEPLDTPIEFVPVDELGRRIHAAVDVLAKDGAIEPTDPQPDGPKYDGYCAQMVAAYKFLLLDDRARPFAGDPDADPRTHAYGPEGAGLRHYWLAVDGGVMDLNFPAGTRPDDTYGDYRTATRVNSRGFLPAKADPTLPNRIGARKIVAVVRDTL